MQINGKDVVTIATGRNGKEYTIEVLFTDQSELFFAGTASACLQKLMTWTPAVLDWPPDTGHRESLPNRGIQIGNGNTQVNSFGVR